MQTITTITAETMNAAGANFQITTFEQKVNVMCDLCGEAASGTVQSLENRGWEIFPTCEFCPDCN